MRGQGATPMETCLRDIDQTDRYVCDERVEALRLGLEEGFAIARRRAIPEHGTIIDWTEASDEIAGRMKR